MAGLDANSAALCATSSNIANVNTVGYKDADRQFRDLSEHARPGAAMPRPASAPLIGQDVTAQGLPTTTSSPTDLSISGNGFFVVATNTSATGDAGIYPRRQLHAGCQRQSGERRRPLSAGLQAGSAGNVPTNASDLSLINVSNLSGTAQPSTTISLQANLQSSSTVDAGYTAGDMTAGSGHAGLHPHPQCL